MNKFRFSLLALAVIAFTLTVSSAVQAQATRTWVSGVGDDANPCSRTAPCKTFAGAISKTAVNGEIDALDPGGFGAVTITKSITLEGDGSGFASILAAGTTGVIINDGSSATPQTAVVRLRNLSINGATTGVFGIRWLSARSVLIENCKVFGFRGNGASSNGLEMNLTAGTGTFTLSVKDSLFENNLGDAIHQVTTVTLNAQYDNVVLANNANGLNATGGTANVSRSVITHNTGSGLSVTGGAVLNAATNQVNSNGTGINCSAGSTARLSDNDIYRNTTGVGGGATFVSFGNNRLLGNNSDGVLPAPTLQK